MIMKILTVSDQVESLLYDRFDATRFQGVDLVLACGDLPPEYLTFLVTRLNVPLYFVKGNHDIRASGYRPDGCIDLDGKLITHRGLRIIGFEGCHWYNGNPHQYTEKQMRRKIGRMRFKIWRAGGIDIVITHAPPRHIHDGRDLCHKGFECFGCLIRRYAPRYFIHGHMHLNYTGASERLTVVNQTQVVNAYGYFLIEIEEEQAFKKALG